MKFALLVSVIFCTTILGSEEFHIELDMTFEKSVANADSIFSGKVIAIDTTDQNFAINSVKVSSRWTPGISDTVLIRTYAGTLSNDEAYELGKSYLFVRSTPKARGYSLFGKKDVHIKIIEEYILDVLINDSLHFMGDTLSNIEIEVLERSLNKLHCFDTSASEKEFREALAEGGYYDECNDIPKEKISLEFESNGDIYFFDNSQFISRKEFFIKQKYYYTSLILLPADFVEGNRLNSRYVIWAREFDSLMPTDNDIERMKAEVVKQK